MSEPTKYRLPESKIPSQWVNLAADLPPGFHTIAQTATCAQAAMSDGQRIVGLQFHPEVAHTPQGLHIIENFCYTLCGCEPTCHFPTHMVE